MRRRDRPEDLIGVTYEMRLITGSEGAIRVDPHFITVNFLGGEPFEVLAKVAEPGTEPRATGETICRLVGMWLSAGGDAVEVIRQLRGIRAYPADPLGDDFRASSLADAIAKALDRALKNPPGQLGLGV